MFQRTRRAFTLIELLCVIAIIGILAAVVSGLTAKPPKGLDGATTQAQSIFAQARAQAMLGNDPDIDLTDNQKQATPLRFIRSRVIVLDDPADPDRTRRFMGVIVGGYRGTDTTKSEKNLQESDLSWYAVNDGVVLPQGYYCVTSSDPNITKAILGSDVLNKTFGPSKMTLLYPRRKVQKSGSGQNYLYYEYLNSGAANMTDNQDKTGARFMVTEGIINPSTSKMEPTKGAIIGGFIVLRPGTTVSINQKSDQQ